MAGRVEVMLPGDTVAQLNHVGGGELDDSPAATANHVIVRSLAEGVLVIGLLYIEADLLEDAAIDQQRKGPVDGGFAHLFTAVSEHIEHLIDLEVLMEFEHGVYDLPPSGGVFDPVILQVFLKDLARVHRADWFGLFHE